MEVIKNSFKKIKNKEFKFIFTIVLVVFTLLVISIYDTMLNYNNTVIKDYAKLLSDKNEQFVQIERYRYYDGVNMISDLGALNDTDTNQINKKLKEMGKTGVNIYRLAHFMPGIGAGEAYIDKDDILGTNENIESNPYTYWCDELDIVEWDDFSNFFIDNIIGRMPESNNEILISNHLADLLIESGIKPYGETDYYKPESYESLVTSSKYFHFGIDKVRIVGIINYDLSKYEDLKNISWNELNSNLEKYSPALEELSDKTKNIYNKIFVNNEFVNHLIVNDSNIPGTSYPRYKINKTGILVMENTQNGFLNLFREFKPNEQISTRSTYSDDVDSMVVTSYWYINRLIYPIILLVILSALLISIFVFSKKDIKELKNRKSKNLYIEKITLCNNTPISIISIILSSIMLIFFFVTIITYLMGEDSINLNTFVLSTRQFVVLFLSMIVIVMISYLISIVRMKIIYKNDK